MIKYWYNDDKDQILRKSRYDVLRLEIPSINRSPGLFREECRNTARELAQQHSSLTLGITGGWQSQIILQSFLDIGFKPNLFVMAFPGKLNQFDYYWAKDYCIKYSLKYNQIDIPGKTFANDLKLKDRNSSSNPWALGIENQIYTYYDLLLASVIQDIDEPVIIGDQLSFRRDEHPEGLWSFILDENSNFWPSRLMQLNPGKTIISDFFTRNSELLYSYLTDPIVQHILSEEKNGKITLVSSRQEIYGNHGFFKRGPSQRTVGCMNIPGLQETNSAFLQDRIGFQNRYLYLEAQKLAETLASETTIWSYV